MKKILEKTFIPVILLVILFLLVIPFMHQNSLLVLLVTVILTAVSFSFFHKKEDIIVYLMGVVLVSLGEIWLVYNNVWIYPQSDVFGVPYYSPFMWGFLFLNFIQFIRGLMRF